MIEKRGEKTLTFELEEADRNLHLMVPVKVLTCQVTTCIRVLGRLGECQQHCVVPCQGAAAVY